MEGNPKSCRSNRWSGWKYNLEYHLKTGNTTSKSTWEDTEIVFPGYYGDAYIFVKRIVTITGAGVDATAKREDKRNKQITFINCAPFTNCIS